MSKIKRFIENMKEIMNLINTWDPIGLFPLAPEDEYSIEIKKIEAFLKENPSPNLESLANRINEIFKSSFGDDDYLEDMDACMFVAQNILAIGNNGCF